uniref:non-specific serine/threonine protein kinase n=1 Tax=Physcomitrium patens TaxID=3218 RepID=A0A2K1L8H2_PHYPA|nr:hypothetical protein PHYPA_000736 [Physcomitrium patens]
MRVGKSELGRSLGAVTFAKIKFAKNLETSQSVAIKVLDKDKILKHKMVQQIKREISMMKLVKHPYIVQLLGSKSKIYIVLEYVTGGELFDKIRIPAEKIYQNFWFKNGYSPPKFERDLDINLDDIDAVFSESTVSSNNRKSHAPPTISQCPPAVNAFELISLSRGLNLSGLFETQSQKRDYKMKLQADKYGRKGHLSVVT